MIRKIVILGAAIWFVILFAQKAGFRDLKKYATPLDSAKKAAIIRAGENIRTVPLCSDEFVLLKNVI